MNHLYEMMHSNDYSKIVQGECPSAIYNKDTMTLYRVHLKDDDENLDQVKQMNKELKLKIKEELIALYGNEWHLRFPAEIPLRQKFSDELN
jgi:hypothetical protein